MKKYFIHLLFVSFIVTSLFTFSLFAPAVASAQTITISQFVELLITIGAIPQDKIIAARAMVAVLNQTGIATTTSTVTISSSTVPYLQILTPNGGQTLELDSDISAAITWGSTYQVPVDISLVNLKGAVCNLHQAPIISKNTQNTFNVLLKTAKCYNKVTGTSTPVVDGVYKARVSYTDPSGAIIKDDSNTTFRIMPIPVPSIKITYPNGAENLVRNQEYEIKFTLKDAVVDSTGLVYLYLLDKDGNIAFNSRKVARDGIFKLDIPSSLTAGAYKVKLKLTTNEHDEIEDTSDNLFWISTGL